jgi:hypothetical protein
VHPHRERYGDVARAEAKTICEAFNRRARRIAVKRFIAVVQFVRTANEATLEGIAALIDEQTEGIEQNDAKDAVELAEEIAAFDAEINDLVRQTNAVAQTGLKDRR